jgi:FKBP-type peptidyl-prolyl cis-trans isomerase
VSYAIGVMWGYQLASDNIGFVDIGNVINTLKQKIKEPLSAENNIYTASNELREFLQKMPRKTYTKQEKKRLETLIGTIWAHQMIETKIPKINLRYTRQGIKELLKEDTSALQIGIQKSSDYILEYKTRLEEVENQKRLEEGLAFLEKNKDEEGVITTESGLQYKVISEGGDTKAEINDTAYLNLVITQIDGDTIETVKSKPCLVSEQRLIKGLFEALQLFGEGAKFTLYVPSELAFGKTIEAWTSQKIKANMVLIYNVEIEKIITNINKKSKKR